VAVDSFSPTFNRREKEREERRASILNAAREILISKGVHQIKVEDIAAAAEVSKGTVYLYFQTKETILAILLQEGLALLIDHIGEAYSAREPYSASDRLRRMAQAYFDFFQQYPHYYRLMILFERRKFQESVDASLYEQTMMRSMRGLSYVVQALEQGILDGEFIVDNTRQSASVLWAMLHGVYMILGNPFRREMLESDLRSLYQSALELAIHGLKSGNSSPH